MSKSKKLNSEDIIKSSDYINSHFGLPKVKINVINREVDHVEKEIEEGLQEFENRYSEEEYDDISGELEDPYHLPEQQLITFGEVSEDGDVIIGLTLPHKIKALAVCTANRYRSRTLHEYLEQNEVLDVKSRGLNKFYVNDTIKYHWDKAQHFTKELYEWADVVYIFEDMHQMEIERRNKDGKWALDLSKIIHLQIEDNYEYNDPELIRQIKEKIKI